MAGAQVAVYGVLCEGKLSTPVDCRLYLPKEWTDDPKRCLEAGMRPEEIVFATKEQLALQIIEHARKQGLKFGWISADAGYGNNRQFLYRLQEAGEKFFIDARSDFHVYLNDPQPRLPAKSGRGRPAKKLETQEPSYEIRRLEGLQKPDRWKEVSGRDSTRGKIKLRVFKQTVWIWDGESDHAMPLILLVSENLDGNDRKYTLTNAPQSWTLGQMVYARSQRYWVERSFEDAKGQCGMADYQAQKWAAWHHHMALVMMAMLFMLQERATQKDQYPMLSCADIEAMLSRFLPRRDVGQDEIIRQLHQRHQLRQRAIQSHTRAAKKREKSQI